ncbi:hypothetical protein GQ53DRAFT_57632 [Thozetella sp. PMI_491]|nr:hypothetical protein GQ53DRAFT_57632 [Thozetella sp. PMI_491]
MAGLQGPQADALVAGAWYFCQSSYGDVSLSSVGVLLEAAESRNPLGLQALLLLDCILLISLSLSLLLFHFFLFSTHISRRTKRTGYSWFVLSTSLCSRHQARSGLWTLFCRRPRPSTCEHQIRECTDHSSERVWAIPMFLRYRT